MSIQVNHLTYVYMPDSPLTSVAVNDVSFDINEGEFLGIIGHTGSGKSTLVQHLNGLLKPASGNVTIDGIDIGGNTTEARQARRRVGLVFQYPEYQLFEETVIKDISFGPRNMGLSEAEIKERAEKAALLVGLPPRVWERSPFELSGGQKRRCAIAGVLAMDPKYLILDEPAAGLDPSGRRDMDNLLMRLNKEQGCTLIMVSHSMDDVARLCDRLIVMRGGSIYLTGAPVEVFAHRTMLADAGLDVPDTVLLSEKLRLAGFEIPDGVFDTADLAEICAQQINEEAR